MGVYALNTENRDEIIVKYLPLVKFIAGRIMINKVSAVDGEDLVSFGIMGLIDAIDKFDPTKGVKFETYASMRIKGAIIDELRKLSWIPRSAMVKLSRLNDVRGSLKNKLDREPTDNELACELEVSIEDLRKIENYINYLSVVSLEDTIFLSDDDELFLYSTLEDTKSPRPDVKLEEKESFEILNKAISMLDEKDKLILSLYYYEKLTLKEIGSVLEVSESRVSQLHSRAILRLRQNMKKLNY